MRSKLQTIVCVSRGLCSSAARIDGLPADPKREGPDLSCPRGRDRRATVEAACAALRRRHRRMLMRGGSAGLGECQA